MELENVTTTATIDGLAVDSASAGSELLAEMLELADYCDERARLLDRDVEQHGYGSTNSRKRWKVKAGTLRATAGEIRHRCQPFFIMDSQ